MNWRDEPVYGCSSSHFPQQVLYQKDSRGHVFFLWHINLPLLFYTGIRMLDVDNNIVVLLISWFCSFGPGITL